MLKFPTMKRINIKSLLNDPATLQQFSKDMAKGAVAIIPTDTLYGLAVAAHSPKGVEKLYKIKGRDGGKPLILFLHHQKELAALGYELDEELRRLFSQYWPGALTAVLPKCEHEQVTAFTFSKMGIRVPQLGSLLSLLELLPLRLLTTSANRSGTEPVNCPEKLAAEFEREVDWLVDGGKLEPSEPSTVVDFSVFPYKVLRQGKIAL
jgi:L-threonylcarbamoyladenylate synthase